MGTYILHEYVPIDMHSLIIERIHSGPLFAGTFACIIEQGAFKGVYYIRTITTSPPSSVPYDGS